MKNCTRADAWVVVSGGGSANGGGGGGISKCRSMYLSDFASRFSIFAISSSGACGAVALLSLCCGATVTAFLEVSAQRGVAPAKVRRGTSTGRHLGTVHGPIISRVRNNAMKLNRARPQRAGHARGPSIIRYTVHPFGRQMQLFSVVSAQTHHTSRCTSSPRVAKVLNTLHIRPQIAFLLLLAAASRKGRRQQQQCVDKSLSSNPALEPLQ